MSESYASASPWIVDASYDLRWFFGGAAASLALLGLYLAGVPILLLWWVWLLGFDGPHIAATFTRTYLDRDEWRRRKELLLLGLLAFAVGPISLLLGVALGSPDPFLLFLALSAFYGYFHVVRQHYGFLALYRAVNRDFDRVGLRVDRWLLYVGCWAPYFYFLLTHPRARALLRLPVTTSEGLDTIAASALLTLWVLAFIVLLVRGGSGGLRQPKAAYSLLTILLYAFIYFAVARIEPVYPGGRGPDQDFLLITALVTVFHNVQYLGLVWFHNRNRYGREGDFGPARWLNRSPGLFLGGCVLFSLMIYLTFACSTGVFPGCAILVDTRVGPFTANQVGLCLWWGLAVHHYYLDQKIWRVRADPVLQKNLRLA